MKICTLLLAGTALGLMLGGTPAHAGVIDTICGPGSEGGVCEPAGESKIFLEAAKDVTVGFGNVGSQTGLPVVRFVSDGGLLDMFIDLSNGFGTIKPTQGSKDFNGLDITIPGYTFTDLVFDEQLHPVSGEANIPFTIAAFDTLGNESDTVFDTKDTDKLFSIVANKGAFTHIDLSTLTGFDEIKHLEISGVEQIPAVPLPPALLLFGSGLSGLLFLTKKKRHGGEARDETQA